MLLVNSVVGSLFRFPPLEQPLESLTVSRKGLPHMAREMTPQATRSDIDSLKIFYNVKTDEELIAVMQHHIEKLQGKLRQVQPSGPAVSQVRA